MDKPGDAAVNIVTPSESSGLYQNSIDLNLSMILRCSTENNLGEHNRRTSRADYRVEALLK
jgi:hypothetical protein